MLMYMIVVYIHYIFRGYLLYYLCAVCVGGFAENT